MTVGCAQCHSHKYDPLTQREYYSLFAFFNSIDEKDIDAPSAEQAASLKTAQRVHADKLAELQAAVATYEKQTMPAAQEKWESGLSWSPTGWNTLELTNIKTGKGGKVDKTEDSSGQSNGKKVQVRDRYGD